jgi:GNAT superfamily N-acetyltransferase
MSIITANPTLPLGYSRVPAGNIANVVICLEMLVQPQRSGADPAQAGLALERWHDPDLDGYRALFRRIGEDWLWVSRLAMTDERLAAIIASAQVEVYVLRGAGGDLGLLELDFRREGECELAFFGLVKEAIGKGAGRFLMDRAIALAWSHPIRRFWVHTCHFDHPAAVGFYQRSGFRAYASYVEVGDDPRHTGLMPRTAAPHVPLLDPGV